MKRIPSRSAVISFFSLGVLALVCAAAGLFNPPAQAQPSAPYKAYKGDYSSIPATSQEIPAAAAAGTVSPAPATPVPETAPYLVRATAGGIGIFRAGESAPLRRLSLDLVSLPADDRRLLEAGIPAESLARAREILEDYR